MSVVKELMCLHNRLQTKTSIAIFHIIKTCWLNNLINLQLSQFHLLGNYQVGNYQVGNYQVGNCLDPYGMTVQPAANRRSDIRSSLCVVHKRVYYRVHILQVINNLLYIYTLV